MKNISLTVSPYLSGAYPAAPPMPQLAALTIPKQSYQVTISAQFDSEAEALNFATKLINVVTGDAE